MKKSQDNAKIFTLIAFWVSCTEISPMHCCSVQKEGKEMQCIKESFWEIKAGTSNRALYRLCLTWLGGTLQIFSDLRFKTNWKESRTVFLSRFGLGLSCEVLSVLPHTKGCTSA